VLVDGQQIFRYDTFGDEQLWTDLLRMHDAVATLTPTAALQVGLKVDREALPDAVVNALESGQVNLNDPAVTRLLLSVDAVVGVIGRIDTAGQVASIGITCALCHSTVDDSLAAGIGRRLDGWANTSLNVGAIVALSPVLHPDRKDVLNSWGAGRYDPRLQVFDGTNIIPLHTTSVPVVIPPVYGLRHVGFETFTGDGPISYWNSYVGVTQMGGHGSFSDPRIGVSVTQTPDLVTPKLPALLAYQLSLRTPPPPPGSFDRVAARRGLRVFNREGRCAECHTRPAFTDVARRHTGPVLHDPADVGADPLYADRSATRQYRTTPLRALWQHPPYFHDGSAADLDAVVERYVAALQLNLTADQKTDLVEFLKSL
jgi:mono/diheme cytochrome c family protein